MLWPGCDVVHDETELEAHVGALQQVRGKGVRLQLRLPLLDYDLPTT